MPLRYFYSRPRVGGDYILQRCEMANAISTHAPAWGATESMSLGRKQRIISTHAPAWGATSPAGTTVGGSNNFYSRPRVGGDLPQTLRHSKLPYFYSRPRVGGDIWPSGSAPSTFYFYSRPRVGGDRRIRPKWSTTTSLFLLTPPRGGRQGAGLTQEFARIFISTHAPAWGATKSKADKIAHRLNFYSRPRVGGDSFPGSQPGVLPLISTHAPAWGATRADSPIAVIVQIISTHAPAWGATLNKGNFPQDRPISTHAPAWGATSRFAHSGYSSDHFYSRPRVGGDGNFSQAPGRCVIQIAEKYTAIQISCPFVHAIFEKLCR